MESQWLDENSLLDNEIDIDLFDAAESILKRIVLVGLVVVIAFFGGKYYGELFVTPKYQASSMLYLFTNNYGHGRSTSLFMGYLMQDDYPIIGKSRDLIAQVMEENGIPGTVEEIQEGLTLAVETDSHLLKISLSNEDPEVCYQMTNLLTERIREQMTESMGGIPPSVATKAVMPRTPVSPNTGRMSKMSAAVAGAVVCLAVVLYDYYFRKVRSEKDVEELLKLKVLGAIPAERPWWQKTILWLMNSGYRRRRRRARART